MPSIVTLMSPVAFSGTVTWTIAVPLSVMLVTLTSISVTCFGTVIVELIVTSV